MRPRLRVSSFFLLSILLCSQPVHAAPQAYDQSDDAAPNRGDVIAGPHVEGHIAFLKAELAITPAQENLWEPVAEAMRQDVHDISNAEHQVARQSHGHEDTIQYLQNRTMFASLRAQGETRFLNAFMPLYDSLSTHQKQIADELLISTGQDQ